MPAASVIIPARDAAATLGRTLEGLSGQTAGDDFDVVVVDDGSTDGTGEIARRAPVVTTVVEGERAGPAAARNLGAAALGAPVLAFLDADCEPSPGWLGAGLEAIKGADLVQGAVRPDPEASLGPFDRTLWVEREHGLYESANLFVTRECFERVGGFESWLRPRRGIELGEDVWFGWRARRAGARTAFCERALVLHAVFPRTPLEFVAERARLRYFPAMARRVPELRDAFFYRRYFLSARSAAFDAALLALAAGRRRPLALAGALPYIGLTVREARRWGGRGPLVACAHVAADAVGCAALAAGSLTRRSLLL